MSLAVMESVDRRELLVRGATLGALAFAAGTLVTYLLQSAVVPSLGLAEGLFLYVLQHGIVMISGPSGTTMLLADSPMAALFWLSIPGLALLLLGGYAASRASLPDDAHGRAALHGASLAAGYALLMVAVALFVSIDVSGDGMFVTGSVSADPLTALLAGVTIPALFGGIGGFSVTWRYGRYLRATLAVIMGLLVLLLFLGATAS